MAVVNDLEAWKKAAEEQAKKYSDEIKTNNQYLIDQLNESKNNTLKQLENQQNNSIYNINSNKSEINRTTEDNARQLNINRLLSLKNNEHAMNRAGLGTQGMVGSQVNSINNNYGSNLTEVLKQKTQSLNDLEREKNDTLLQYNTNRLNLENEYGNNLANLRQSIDDKALNQYNSVYNNYLAMKQQEYENAKAEEAAAEARRQWEAEYNLSKQAYNSSRSSSSNYSSNSDFSSYFNDSSSNLNGGTDAYGNSIETQNRSDYLFGDEAGQREQHPQYIGNQKVKSAGLVKNVASGATQLGVGGNQNVWTAGGEYYVWVPNSTKTGGVYTNVTAYFGNKKANVTQPNISNQGLVTNLSNKVLINSKVISNGTEYKVYKANGEYYYGNGAIMTKITNTSLINQLKQNKKASYTLR